VADNVHHLAHATAVPSHLLPSLPHPKYRSSHVYPRLIRPVTTVSSCIVWGQRVVILKKVPFYLLDGLSKRVTSFGLIHGCAQETKVIPKVLMGRFE
jgi:hypothetical protein